MNLFQLLGSFSTNAGVVIGTPFVIGPSGSNSQVPVGATRVQVGFNECRFDDNSGALLTFRLDYWEPYAKKAITLTWSASNPPPTVEGRTCACCLTGCSRLSLIFGGVYKTISPGREQDEVGEGEGSNDEVLDR